MVVEGLLEDHTGLGTQLRGALQFIWVWTEGAVWFGFWSDSVEVCIQWDVVG